MPIYDYVIIDFESEGYIQMLCFHNSIDVKIEDLSVLSSLTNAHNIVKPWVKYSAHSPAPH